MKSKNEILFEGRMFDPHSLGRIFRRGSTLIAEVDGRVETLYKYPSAYDAELGRRYFLFRLGRRDAWI